VWEGTKGVIEENSFRPKSTQKKMLDFLLIFCTKTVFEMNEVLVYR
jgi:hypothetical protein